MAATQATTIRQVIPRLTSSALKPCYRTAKPRRRRFLRSYPHQEAYLLDRARQFRAALTLPLGLAWGIPIWAAVVAGAGS
jgi:hypothetical protein